MGTGPLASRTRSPQVAEDAPWSSGALATNGTVVTSGMFAVTRNQQEADARQPGPSDRALDLRLELDVAAQEVVVLLAERLRVAALPRLRRHASASSSSAIDQLLRLGERLDDRARAVVSTRSTWPLSDGPRNVSTTVSGCWLRIVRAIVFAGQVGDVLGDHRVVERARC